MALDLGEGNGTPLQCSCLENPMDGGAMGCSPWGRKESDMTEQLHFHFSLSCIGKGNGNPLQSSCLENPRDREAWWAAVSGVAQSQTRLKWLSSMDSFVVSYIIKVIFNVVFNPNTKAFLLALIFLVFLTESKASSCPERTWTEGDWPSRTSPSPWGMGR